jgi:putative spermidine/putrescine transport system ATP-binding protein
LSASATSLPAVELKSLRRAFGPVVALNDFSLEIAPGELVALLGPSGCGKTTALRALAGLQDLDSGQIVVQGKDITHMRASKRDMGMVFQSYSLFPHMSAQENVEYGLRLRKESRNKNGRAKRAIEMLELVGLDTQAKRFPHQLSGGQQQRVALARALAIAPDVLLLDEPLSALDAKVRSQLRDEIRRIQLELGTTTLFVTHDQEEALGVADRVGVMSEGSLAQIASPAELYERPTSALVAEFVGLTTPLPCDVADGRAHLLGSSVPVLPGSVTSGPALALLRPESIDLVPDPQSDSIVLTVSFLGSVCRILVQLPNKTLLTVQASSERISDFPPGSRVGFSFHAQPVFAKSLPT